jgi:Ca2+-binding RTX toxin-like protein
MRLAIGEMHARTLKGTAALLTSSLLGAAALLMAAPAADSDGAPRCGGKRATMVGGPGDNRLIAPAKGKQVIVGGGGDDKIVAKRNHDVVCGGDGNDVILAGQGKDRVYAGSGDDVVETGRGFDKVRGEDGNDRIGAGAGGDRLYGDLGYDQVRGDTGKDRIFGGTENDSLNGGPGGDFVYGESGDDTLQGDSGGDELVAGSGNDRLYGELQDDHMLGGDGDDLMVGDQGIDRMEGESGQDWMRGGTNQDRYLGGPGSDTISFATATPPGPTPEITGVQVDLQEGFAKGDGGSDTIAGTENVLGSPYADKLTGTGNGQVDGLWGDDECDLFDAQLGCTNPGFGSRAIVMLEGGPDPGVIVIPQRGAANETISISRTAAGVAVNVSTSLDARQGCQGSGGAALCPDPAVPLGYVAAFGYDGDDNLRIGPGFAYTTTVDLDGGNGDDRLEGNSNNDNLYAGEFGQDVLIGNSGGDALISEAGRDVLQGGPGNDNLVTTSPCDGHSYDGGTGAADVAGFGRTYYRPVVARLGGTGIERGVKNCAPTRIGRNLEVLEGTRFSDILYARRRKDLLIGREGRDRCFGGRHLGC